MYFLSKKNSILGLKAGKKSAKFTLVGFNPSICELVLGEWVLTPDLGRYVGNKLVILFKLVP
jgi:hypothetical protein